MRGPVRGNVANRWVGQSVRRKEDDRLLRGLGQFVADVSFPDQVHLLFVRSPLAHARIVRIDASSALEIPGVIAVLTGDDVPSGPMPAFLWDTPPPKLVEAVQPLLRPCHPPLLPIDKVRFVGQAVAVVVAASRYLAEDAAERVEIDYESLPVASSLEEALKPGAPVVHDGWEDNVAAHFVVGKGDVDAALSDAHLVIRERFSTKRQAGIPLETRGAVAQFAGEHLTLWSATQNAHPLRRAMSRVSGLPRDRVDVVAPDVGGGFGTKGVLYPEDLLVGLVAMRLGRPAKWVEDRAEHMQSAIHAREQVHDIEIGFTREGRITALRDRFLVDTGAFNPLGLVIPFNTIAHLMGPYRVPHLEATATCVITNKVPTAPYRGAGRPEAVFAVERGLDRAARRLGIDPVELRLGNLIRPEDMPYEAGIVYRDGEPLVMDSGNYPEALRRTAALIDYDGVRIEAASGRGKGRSVGVGFACYVEGTGIGPFEGAAVRVEPTGEISVSTGACSQGQGHQTVFAQLCADHLGVDLSDVRVVGGDTRRLERGWGTVASRSAVVAGNAVAEASRALRDQVVKLAAELLEVSLDDLVIEAGRVTVAGAPERSVSLAEVARAVDGGTDLEATSYYEPPTVTWSGGVHAAVVEVDTETGEIRILKYGVVHDCGRVINPMIVDGQVRGGVAQGIGSALYEEIVYGDEGQLLSVTMADYLVPTAAEVPPIALEHMHTPSPLNALGIKGMGEGGAIPVAAAVANAVEDALSSYEAVVRRIPLMPEYVRSLVRE